MEPEWRILEKGEIIQPGDEVDACNDGWRDKTRWVPAMNIGEPACDPSFPSHRTYRRQVPPPALLRSLQETPEEWPEDSQSKPLFDPKLIEQAIDAAPQPDQEVVRVEDASTTVYWPPKNPYRYRSGFPPPIAENEELLLFVGGPWDGQWRPVTRHGMGQLIWNVQVPTSLPLRYSCDKAAAPICRYIEVFPGIMRDSELSGPITKDAQRLLQEKYSDATWREPTPADDDSYCYLQVLPKAYPPMKIVRRRKQGDGVLRWYYEHLGSDWELHGLICRCWRPGELK